MNVKKKRKKVAYVSPRWLAKISFCLDSLDSGDIITIALIVD